MSVRHIACSVVLVAMCAANVDAYQDQLSQEELKLRRVVEEVGEELKYAGVSSEAQTDIEMRLNSAKQTLEELKRHEQAEKELERLQRLIPKLEERWHAVGTSTEIDRAKQLELQEHLVVLRTRVNDLHERRERYLMLNRPVAEVQAFNNNILLRLPAKPAPRLFRFRIADSSQPANKQAELDTVTGKVTVLEGR